MNKEKINRLDIAMIMLGALLTIALILMTFSVCSLFVRGAGNVLENLNEKQQELDDKQQKAECYEIYVEDNVILKRCEKYFKDSDD